MMGENMRVIIDTDIGSDVDDALALALALKSKEIQLEAVTLVYGNVDLRAKIALKMLKLAGFEGISVAKGIEKPLLREREVFWTGHEGEGFLTPMDDALKPAPIHAIDLIISKVMSMKRMITLITLGPLTNMAAAIIKEPQIIENIKEVFIMGGVTRLSDGFNLPFREHNIYSDPEAAKVVFNSGLPITMVPLDVTLKVAINRENLEEISHVGTPFTDAIVSMVERYLEFCKRDYTWLHDPLTVAASIDQSLVKTKAMKVIIETKGEATVGQTLALAVPPREANAKICIGVDADRFKRFFMERIQTA